MQSSQVDQNHYDITTREHHWSSFISQVIDPFWEQYAQQFQLINKQNLTLHYVTVACPNSTKWVMLSPGRVETYLKYKEVIYDLFKAGYSVLAMDHQGQGLSDRRLVDKEKGYVESFDDYAHDLQLIIEHSGIADQTNQLFVLAHSMGCAIVLNWQRLYQPKLQCQCLCAPMLGLKAGPLNAKQAQTVVAIYDRFLRCFGVKIPYFFGQHSYRATPYELNVLTRSRVRYEYTQAIQAQHKLGGVTTKWLYEAFKVIRKLLKFAPCITCNSLVFQAKRELVVSMLAQNKWVEASKNSDFEVQFKKIKKAHHEILMEIDSIRAPVMQQIIEFFNAHYSDVNQPKQ